MAAARKHEIPVIPEEFIITLPQAKGKRFITANGLIYLGHMQGLKRIDAQIVQLPTKDNPCAIVRCEVETDLGVFSDYGEVNPSNKGTVGGSYPVSMATTRARNRALRIATGCPLTSYEEMGMEADDHPQPEQVVRHSGDDDEDRGLRPQAPARPVPAAQKGAPPDTGEDVPTPEQLEKLLKLKKACGLRTDDLPDDLTGTQARGMITNLVAEFNAQARGARKG